MCGSMVDIQSATAENRPGKKKKKKKPQRQNIMACPLLRNWAAIIRFGAEVLTSRILQNPAQYLVLTCNLHAGWKLR